MSSVLASAGLAVFAVLAFAANLAGPREPLILLWLAAPLSTAVPAVLAIRIAADSRFHRHTRRFWRHLAGTTTLVGIGATLNAVDALGGGAPTQAMSPWTVAAYGLGVAVLLAGMFRLPMDLPGRGDKIRVALDAGTVVLAATVFMWQFQSAPMLEATGFRSTAMLAVGLMMVMELVTVFAIAKVALASRAYVAPKALRLFALGLLGGVNSSFLQALTLDRPWLNLAQVTIPIVMICATAGAEAQRRSDPEPRLRGTTARRRFSLLPYLAVAGVLVVLVLLAWPYADLRLVVCAAVVLTTLVVWRQLSAFRENAELVARLDHSSTHDPLTGLPNRALFHERLTAALPEHRVSVALIDLDDFKTVNDTLGHGAGDALLTGVAQRLLSRVRPGDTVARLGGDEFVVLLVDAGEDEASRTAERMIEALTPPVVADGHELLARASIGLASHAPETGGDTVELLRRADIAMYAAKHGGGSHVRAYAPGMDGAVADTAALGACLQEAITGGQLELDYQPIVALGTREVVAVEALVRWRHPERGRLSPDQFLPVAERTGSIVALGEWVLRTACARIGPFPSVGLSVNVSAREISEAGFAERVTAILAEAGMDPRRLTLEVTERAARLGDPLARVRLSGVRVCLDDFGTGASSVTLLHELPLDQLKLDGSFLHGAAGVLALAEAAGLEVVAEGVETAGQAAWLEGLGFGWGQGFHFARPVPGAEVGAVVTSRVLSA